MADCVQVVDPLRPVDSILPQSQTCGQNIAADGNSLKLQQIPYFPSFTANQINTADISQTTISNVPFVLCRDCTQCRACVSTGTVTGQTACVGAPGGNSVGCH